MMIRAFLTTLLLITSLALSACGMRPVYGTHAYDPQTRADISSVSISNIPDRVGQNLRNKLIDMMYTNGFPGASAKYHLNINPINEEIRDLSIGKDASSTRSQIRLYTHMTLSVSEGKVLLARNIQAITSYNNMPNEYTTYVLAQSVRDSASNELAKQIVTALELYFANPDAYTAQDALETPASLPKQDNLLEDKSTKPLH